MYAYTFRKSIVSASSNLLAFPFHGSCKIFRAEPRNTHL